MSDVVTAGSQRQQRKLFESQDIDNSGGVDEDEIAKFFEKMGLSVDSIINNMTPI